MKKKFYLLKLQIRNGDAEFTSMSLHTISSLVTDYAENYASTFYGKNDEEANGWYLFFNGQRAVTVESIKEVTADEYAVLQKYL